MNNMLSYRCKFGNMYTQLYYLALFFFGLAAVLFSLPVFAVEPVAKMRTMLSSPYGPKYYLANQSPISEGEIGSAFTAATTFHVYTQSELDNILNKRDEEQRKEMLMLKASLYQLSQRYDALTKRMDDLER